MLVLQISLGGNLMSDDFEDRWGKDRDRDHDKRDDDHRDHDHHDHRDHDHDDHSHHFKDIDVAIAVAQTATAGDATGGTAATGNGGDGGDGGNATSTQTIILDRDGTFKFDADIKNNDLIAHGDKGDVDVDLKVVAFDIHQVAHITAGDGGTGGDSGDATGGDASNAAFTVTHTLTVDHTLTGDQMFA
jgi:hypothetical protein